MTRALPQGRLVSIRPALVVLIATTLLVLASLRTHPQADELLVEVQRVPLDPSDLSRGAVGPLVYRGGIWLRSEDPRFGGLSDLRVSSDGARLLAVSDCGHGFAARLAYDDRGWLVDLVQARLVPLVGLDGEPLARGDSDAEALAREGDGVLVAFEGRPRLWRYARVPPFAGPAESRPLPPVDGACRGNRGLEVLTDLEGGGLFLACEARTPLVDTTTAWVGSGDAWKARSYPLLLEGVAAAFSPTAAAALPNGDVLVLERRFPPLGVRVVRLEGQDLRGEGALSPVEVVRLEPPLNLDNFEGLDVRKDASGALLLYLLSDDNGCSKHAGVHSPRLQRTLLLMFELRS